MATLHNAHVLDFDNYMYCVGDSELDAQMAQDAEDSYDAEYGCPNEDTFTGNDISWLS